MAVATTPDDAAPGEVHQRVDHDLNHNNNNNHNHNHNHNNNNVDEEHPSKRLKTTSRVVVVVEETSDSTGDDDRGAVASESLSLLSSRPSPFDDDVAKVGHDVRKLRAVFERLGFRTALVSSPRPALSVYADSCGLRDDDDDGAREWTLVALGRHPRQEAMERAYRGEDEGGVDVRSRYQASSLARFAARTAADPFGARRRDREADRIRVRDCTLANARLALFAEAHGLALRDARLRRCPGAPRHERVTLTLVDPARDDDRDDRAFAWSPSLTTLLREGPAAVAERVLECFWEALSKRGYHAARSVREAVSPELRKFVLSGVGDADPNSPLPLNAQFSPTYPFSLYLHGAAGTGKSSFARRLAPALEDALVKAVDPALTVESVQQNLNKPSHVLSRDFELRPNNNDLSVKAVVQRRRNRRPHRDDHQPSLVVLDLEEMGSPDPPVGASSPDAQTEATRLLGRCFAGHSDPSVMVVVTSNYPLASENRSALVDAPRSSGMFRNLAAVRATAVDREERAALAETRLAECLRAIDPARTHEVDWSRDVSPGEGDVRALVRRSRTLALYVAAPDDDDGDDGVVRTRVDRDGSDDALVVRRLGADGRVATTTRLVAGPSGACRPAGPRVFADARVRRVAAALSSRHGADRAAEMAGIVEHYLVGALAPAVVASRDAVLVRDLVRAVSSVLGGTADDDDDDDAIDASRCRMCRGPYDHRDTANLRDEIARRRARNDENRAAIELVCPDAAAQTNVREMLEDSPSMTTISTARSALRKAGLFFGVVVVGDLTPEIRSRASLIL